MNPMPFVNSVISILVEVMQSNQHTISKEVLLYSKKAIPKNIGKWLLSLSIFMKKTVIFKKLTLFSSSMSKTRRTSVKISLG
jgi:hypothetical protein